MMIKKERSWHLQMIVHRLIFLFLCFGITTCQNKTESTTKEACKDNIPSYHCEILERNGACQSSLSRMLKLCPKTCQFCDEYCKDFLPFLCSWWHHHHACVTHPHVLHTYCRKSCGKCGLAAAPPNSPPCAYSKYGCCWDKKTAVRPDAKCPECKDQYRFCRNFVKECFYGMNRELMHKKCPRTCRRCTPIELGGDETSKAN